MVMLNNTYCLLHLHKIGYSNNFKSEMGCAVVATSS